MFLSYVDNFVEKYADPRANEYFLGRSIWNPISVILIYLLFVYKIGPWFMKDKKPYNCRNWIIAFDIIQIILNIWIGFRAFRVFFRMKGTFWCLPLDTSYSEDGMEGVFLTHCYHLLKLSDMIDTVFFILKTNYRQASYLHIYHHTAMIFFSWYALKFVPGGQSAYIGLANTVVHVIMYAYYLLTGLNPRYKNIALKKFVTTVQLIQFTFLGSMYASSLRPSCNFSKAMSVICIFQAVYFLYLFGIFYYESYIKVKPDKKH